MDNDQKTSPIVPSENSSPGAETVTPVVAPAADTADTASAANALTEATALNQQFDRELTSAIGATTSDPVPQIDADQLAKDFNKLERRKKTRKIILISLLAIALLTFVFIVICLVFKLDSSVFPVTVYGKVVDASGIPLENVNVCTQSKCAKTDVSGNYTLEKLTYGNYNVSATLFGYKDYSKDLTLERGKNEVNISLKVLGSGNLTGKVTASKKLDTTDMVITFDGQLVLLNEDNSFEIYDKTEGTYALNIATPGYIDVVKSITVSEGENDLGTIQLEPGMDIRFTVNDWLQDGPLMSAIAKINSDSTFKADVYGEITIKDQPYKGKFTCMLVSEGYLDETIELDNLKQGMNEVDPYAMVRSGKVAYVSDRLGYENIYVSNYDGSKEEKLTPNKYDSKYPEYVAGSDTVKFLSARDLLQNDADETIYLPYSYNLETGDLTKIPTSDYSGSLIGYYSFTADLRAYLKIEYVGGSHLQNVYVSKLDGSNNIKEYSLESGQVTGIRFSPDSKFMYISWENTGTAKNSLYKVNLESGTNENVYSAGNNQIAVLDVSPDNNNVLIKVGNADSISFDLYQLNLSTARVSRLTNNNDIENDVRYSPDGQYIYYTSKRDGLSDIYRINVNGENEVRITTNGKVSSFYLLSNEVLSFTASNDLYILDVSRVGYAPRLSNSNTSNDTFDIFSDYYKK